MTREYFECRYPAEISEEGFGGFRDIWHRGHVAKTDLEAILREEAELMRVVDAVAATAEAPLRTERCFPRARSWTCSRSNERWTLRGSPPRPARRLSQGSSRPRSRRTRRVVDARWTPRLVSVA